VVEQSGRPRPALRLLHTYCHRRHRELTVIIGVAVTAALVVVIAGRWDQFSAAIGSVPAGIVVAGVVLQLVALLFRTEAWHVCVTAAGATVSRRRLYRASSMGCVGGSSTTSMRAGLVPQPEPPPRAVYSPTIP
jgi:uncharacterized membrane protein YbhN (UPF0104 family)